MSSTASRTSASRLRELLGVLRKRDIRHGMTPKKLRLILEDLGPTYVKLGQIMSTRTDILPQSYCDELALLCTTVQPVPFDQVLEMIREEYGRSANQVFSWIDPTPLGSASIAQVYRASLRETHEDVVIKVQRPGIHDTMSLDVKLMHKAVRLLRLMGMSESMDVFDFDAVIDEMWRVAQQEMNFLLEADHNEEFAERNKDIVYVTCPKVNRRLTTERILVMERIHGIPIDHLKELEEAGYDVEEIGRKLAENYSKQVLDDAFFHADPHQGNVWISEGKIVFLDLGMVGRLSQRDRMLLRQAFSAAVTHDVATMEDVLLTIGMPGKYIDYARLYGSLDELMRKYLDESLADINLGLLVQQVLDIAHEFDITIPASITMLARGLMTLEGVLAKCCPNVSLVEIIRTHLASEVLDDFDLKKEMRRSMRTVYESAKGAVEIPATLSSLLKLGVKGRTKLNLEIVGSEEPLRKIDTMVNKLIVGIIAAALFMGSSVICTTDIQPLIFGHPLLGVAGFLVAFVLCGILLLKIRGEHRRKRPKLPPE
jgi:ubiquinone biosynthesis protein